jgi:hypothetical protein
MYNRYTPQPDGSYHRNRISEQKSPQHPNRPPNPGKPPVQPQEPPCSSPPSNIPEKSAGNFLKNLLPKEFDTGDLLIILLLVLMAGSDHENSADALLTLALYLIL